MRDNWDDLRFNPRGGRGRVGQRRRAGVSGSIMRPCCAGWPPTRNRQESRFSTRPRAATWFRGRKSGLSKRRARSTAPCRPVARMLQGARAPLVGEVRVTSTDTFCQCVLPPILADLRRGAPNLRIELLCSNAHLDLARTHADITVRPSEALAEDLVGEVAAELGFGLFRRKTDRGTGWLGLSGPLARSIAGRWLSENVEPDRILASADSFVVLREMAAMGQGMAILPHLLATKTRGLNRSKGSCRRCRSTFGSRAMPIWPMCRASPKPPCPDTGAGRDGRPASWRGHRDG